MKMEKIYFIESKEEYLRFVESWKKYVNSGGTTTAKQHLLYNTIRSKNPFRGFAKGSNERKAMSRPYKEWNGYLLAFTALDQIIKYGRSNAAKEVCKPFGMEDGEKCVELIKRAFEVIKNVPIPE